MSESAIRAAIKAKMLSIDGIGQVHDYERFSNSLAKWLDFFRADGETTVKGWVIHREATPAQFRTMPNVDRQHHFRIAGVYTLNDAAGSEKTFQALVELLFTTFCTDIQLGGACDRTEPFQVLDVTTLEYKDTLYHIADCLLVTHETATWGA